MSTVRGPGLPSGTTRLAAVIGDPVRHSLSPLIHNTGFRALGLDWVFVALAVERGRGAAALDAMRTLGIDGLSVTMPLKAEVMVGLDRVSSLAERLGAVNVIARVGRELVGDNTDGPGFVNALRHDQGFEPEGKRCVVVGAGGAARAVMLALAEAGAAEVTVVARRTDQAVAAVALAGDVGRVGVPADVANADLVVNATPVGMQA
ncbi:MAG: NAD(P)-dependent oxidoreductase, partial [Acidimicrobiales bacterium]